MIRFNRGTKLLATFVVMLAVSVPARASEEEPITLIESSNSGLVVELNLPAFEKVEVEGPDSVYERIILPGWGRTIEVGCPELPRMGILIEVPLEGAVELRVTESRFRSLSGCMIHPVPRLRLSPGGERREEFVKSDSVYSSPEVFPGELATIDSSAMLRGRPVARILFFPFQWNPLTRELRCYEKIRVQIRFEQLLPPAMNEADRIPPVGSDRLYDDMLRKVVLNHANRRPPLREKEPCQPGRSERSDRTGLRLEIVEDGIHRLTYDDLSAAGVDPQTIDPQTFQVFYMGEEAAIAVETAGSQVFAPGDSIEFFAEAIEYNLFTETNVYWLYWGGSTGKRMATKSGKVSDQGVPVDLFRETLHDEEDLLWWEAVPGGTSVDYWFWDAMYAPETVSITMTVPAPDPAQTDAVLRVGFRGVSTAPPHPNHHTRILLNNTLVADDFWDNDTEFIQKGTIPQGVLLDGDNTVTIDLPADTGAPLDVVCLNWIELDYWRRFETIDDELDFSVEGSDRLRIDVGLFGSRKIKIFDITDPYQVEKIDEFTRQTRLKGRAQPCVPISPQVHPGDFRAVFEADVDGTRRFRAMTADRIRTPAKVELWEYSDLKNTANGADFILVTSIEFLSDLSPLVQYRANQGLRTAAVAVEDIYNEFNFGLFHPSALKSFLQYAYDYWTPPAPSYVLFVGDASADYRDKLGTGKVNIVPVHMFDSDLGVTPNDNWYVCVDGADDLPDMFLGRIPAVSAAAAADMAGKVVGFEQSTSWKPDTVLLSADDEIGFENLNEDMIPFLPPGFNVDKVYLSSYTNVNNATQDIITSIDGGAMIANYVGHGAVTNWAGEMMFVSADVADLNNGDYLTFVITMTCLNGYFAQPDHYCIAEEFMAATGKGAISSYAPSGLGYLWEHEILDAEVFTTIFDQQQRNLGFVTTQSKIAAHIKGMSLDSVQLFTFFGDPATDLKDWN